MLAKLKAIQERDNLNDEDMAAKLGISRSAWSLIRRDKMPLSDAVAVRAVGAYPELTRDLLDRAESTAVSVANIRVAADENRGPA